MRIYDGSNDKKAVSTNHTVSVVSANKIVCKNDDSMTIRKNGRADWSLYYCESGSIYFEECRVDSGKIWIYPPNVPQKYTVYRRDKTVYRYLHFTGSDIKGLLSSLDIAVREAIDVKHTSVSEVFEKIQDCLTVDSVLSMLKAECHTLHLISKIANSGNKTTDLYIMKRVTDDMEHTFVNEYDPKRYADMFNISVSRFNHLFKESVGVAPYTYYIGLRLSNACALLEDTSLKIKDISERCGYSDAMYFTQAFKKEKGVTPSAYRKLNSIV